MKEKEIIFADKENFEEIAQKEDIIVLKEGITVTEVIYETNKEKNTLEIKESAKNKFIISTIIFTPEFMSAYEMPPYCNIKKGYDIYYIDGKGNLHYLISNGGDGFVGDIQKALEIIKIFANKRVEEKTEKEVKLEKEIKKLKIELEDYKKFMETIEKDIKKGNCGNICECNNNKAKLEFGNLVFEIYTKGD